MGSGEIQDVAQRCCTALKILLGMSAAQTSSKNWRGRRHGNTSGTFHQYVS